ncbi:hypothetical protein ACOSP7_004888 [Xanthoceras sorbifolium]
MNATRKGSISVNKYVLKMKGYSEALTAAGQLLSTDDVVSSVLGGLGPEYDPVVVTITARQSYISAPNQGPRGRSRGRGRGRYGNRGGLRFFCQLCGKNGHAVTTCYHSFDHNFQGVNHQQFENFQQ